MTNALKEREGPNIRLPWLPANTDTEGHRTAHQLAKDATGNELPESKDVTVPAALTKAAKLGTTNSNRLQYDIDSELPGNHTRLFYDNCPYEEAAILCQLKPGKSRLNSYLAKIQAAETKRCECRGNPSKTTQHFLFECPR